MFTKRRAVWGVLLAMVLEVFSFAIPRGGMIIFQNPRVRTLDEAPEKPVAIVFGAGLRRDGRASAVLRDRIYTAAQLYFAGKADFLLLSGDNSTEFYNEPAAMWEYAVSLGVPEDRLVLDYAGRRTYDTCFRARDIFHVKEAVLVTQAFHQPRALFTCNALGVASVGVPARESRYWRGAITSWTIREFPAAAAAVWDVYVFRPIPILGEIEPIPLEAH